MEAVRHGIKSNPVVGCISKSTTGHLMSRILNSLDNRMNTTTYCRNGKQFNKILKVKEENFPRGILSKLKIYIKSSYSN